MIHVIPAQCGHKIRVQTPRPTPPARIVRECPDCIEKKLGEADTMHAWQPMELDAGHEENPTPPANAAKMRRER